MLLALGLAGPAGVRASTGQEAASFLDIPVGARPAALGGAYSALSHDAYAIHFNPAGLAFTSQTQAAAQHLAYLQSIHYEQLSIARPWGSGGIGLGIQYLGSGDMPETSLSGQRLGQYSAYYAAYSAGYGRRLGDRWSAGVTARWIQSRLADVRGSAWAADAGVLWRPVQRWSASLTATNWGERLRYLSQSDRLPRAVKASLSYTATRAWTLSSEAAYRPEGAESFHAGAEWRPLPPVALRAGYRTDIARRQAAPAGFSGGLGLTLWNQELAYAWVPYGDLGSTQYISFIARLGDADSARQNLAIHITPRYSQVPSKAVYDYDYSELSDEAVLKELIR